MRKLLIDLAPASLAMGFEFTLIVNGSANPIAVMFAGFSQNADFDLGSIRSRDDPIVWLGGYGAPSARPTSAPA